MRLYLARHGQSLANQENRFQGHKDYPLSNKGKCQAAELSARLHYLDLDMIISSDLERARHTAIYIAAKQGKIVRVTPKIREYGWGIIEGLTREEIKEVYPTLSKRITENFYSTIIPGQENRACFKFRLKSVIKDIRALSKNQDISSVLLVSHARFLNALICLLLNRELNDFMPFSMKSAALTIINFEETHNRLILFNDTCHLSKDS